MLLYLAIAPLLPPCLKIAVNYKCSLNVSSDPEMQVGVRRRGDPEFPSFDGKKGKKDPAFLTPPPPPVRYIVISLMSDYSSGPE